ncbi:hypothetical protein Mapa_005247 [Marchantia paleacea]|nr:hypothetical protein Mapa_005247 [Marchantia paleacea]
MIMRVVTEIKGCPRKRLLVKLEFLILLVIACACFLSENVEASSLARVGNVLLSPESEENAKGSKDRSMEMSSESFEHLS